MARRYHLSRLALPFLLAATLSAGDRSLVPEINHFATALYQQLATGEGNCIFSSFGISSALSMTLMGARGRTATEIATLLHQPYPEPEYHAAFAALIEQLTKAAIGGGNQLLDANGLWAQRGFPVTSDFRRSMETVYRAPLVQLDFFHSPESARAEINSWTGQHTNGKIKELFAPGSLNSMNRLVLSSAVYFYGKWQSAFRTENTHPLPFRLPAGGAVETPFMNQTGSFGYTETASAQILEMKYAGTGIAFDALLPKTAGGLSGLERSMTVQNLAAWLGGLENRTVAVSIPKFRADSEFPLAETLARMGMHDAFSQSADFSGIDDRRDLTLSAFLHKAFVDVAEEGTEAAAATGVAARLISMHSPTVFRADHPFAFLIRDTRSGLILFAGRLQNPTR